MKAIIFTAPRVAEFIERDIPEIKADEVLIKLVCSTVSPGTERANYVGDPNVSYAHEPSVKFPRRVGYSSSGIVVKVGDAVTGVKVGDRVACFKSVHAEYCVMNEKYAHPIPDELSFSEAAMLHIATFPLAAIRKCRLEIGESAIVMGQGVLGMMAVEFLRAAGACPIIAVDPIKEKREQAIELGADYALDPFEADFAETVKKLTNGGANVAIEVTGKGQGLDMVLDCMARFGRVALLGCTRNSDFSIDYYRKVHGPGITLVGAHTNARPDFESSPGWWTSWDDTEALIKLMLTKRIDLLSLVAETHSPEKAQEIYTRLANEPTFPVVQFDWSDI